jgi:hypothetical protein
MQLPYNPAAYARSFQRGGYALAVESSLRSMMPQINQTAEKKDRIMA